MESSLPIFIILTMIGIYFVPRNVQIMIILCILGFILYSISCNSKGKENFQIQVSKENDKKEDSAHINLNT